MIGKFGAILLLRLFCFGGMEDYFIFPIIEASFVLQNLMYYP